MRLSTFIVSFALLGGCSWSEETYYEKAAEAECDLGLECFNEARLNFLGWTDLETCITIEGPNVAGRAAGCATYDAKAAKACVKELDARACPEEGQEPSYPQICESVFTDCEGNDPGDDTGDDTGVEA